ncbi:MAG: SLBB domain-containing protein [Acidimicrobiia bacterium]|nr:SLBB domain-containing protein [Acidimicrobiia bacterium]
MTSTEAALRRVAPPPDRLPRLLAEADPGWLSVGEHRAFAGPLPQIGRRPRADVVALVSRSGLRGKGGGGFPTGRKLQAVADGSGRPVVIANGCEGEPASGKDKLLLSLAPHLVLDGALVAAAAVGAREVIVCVDRRAGAALAAVRRALDERVKVEPTPIPVRVAAVPTHYVAGEESALVHWLNGGEAKPTVVPPRPFQRGVGGRPTLVDNVETLAHVAQIARWGSEWFRSIGTPAEPGSTLLSVSGGVQRPGIYEVPLGARLGRLLERAGAVTDDVSAVLLGGYFGTWLPIDLAVSARLGCETLAPFGAGLGAGVVLVLPRAACGIAESARVMAWLASQTAGQCGSCVNGLASLAEATSAVARGRAPRDAARALLRWADQVEGRGACRLPDGAARFLRSALHTFHLDLDRHLRDGSCASVDHRPVLPVPAVSGESWR